MSKKDTTSTSTVSVPQDVLNRYNSVNQTAQSAAATPFTPYSYDTKDFVSPINATQQAGIDQTRISANMAQGDYMAALGLNQEAVEQGRAGNAQAGTSYGSAYNAAQPYNAVATGLGLAGAGAVNAQPLGEAEINKYMSPYIHDVAQSEAALLNQTNQQAMAGQTGNAIRSGAFGGDRAGIAAAVLQGQNQLANANIFSNILNTGYNTALGAAQQQQGVNLGAGQANRAALQGAASQLQGIGQQQFNQGSTLGQEQQGLAQQSFNQGLSSSQNVANIGNQAQTSNLQGAQAELAAGTTQQQTDQAGRTAMYNQFLQQQSYPFQVAQFLANIAEGTGSLSGSTTTSTQPGGFFSDERLKEDIKPIGKTYDDQTVYSYRYKGEPRKQIGLIAQEVKDKHPEAVGLHGGFHTVDYDKATKDASERGHYASGGAAYDPETAWLMAQQQMYAPLMGGLGGTQAGQMTAGYVPKSDVPVSGLMVAQPVQTEKHNYLKEAADTADSVESLYGAGKKAGLFHDKSDIPPHEDDPDKYNYYRGGLARNGYADGGMPYSGLSGLQIPDDKPQAQLQKLPDPQTPGQQESGFHKTTEALGDVAKIASLFAMFKDGGSVRPHMAGGGLIDWLKNVAQPYEEFPSAPVEKQTAIRNVPLDADDGSQPPAVLHRAAPAPVRHHAQPRGLAAVAQPAAPEMAVLATRPHQETPLTETSLAHQQPLPDVSNDNLQNIPTVKARNGLDGLGTMVDRGADTVGHYGKAMASGLGAAAHRYGDSLKQGDAQSWVPLLSSIAAMGTAPTRSLGVALASGLGAGTKSYMDTKQQLANVAQTRQGTYNAMQGNAPEGYIAIPGAGPDGKGFPGADGRIYHYELKPRYTDYDIPYQTPAAGGNGQPQQPHDAETPVIAPDYANHWVSVHPGSTTDEFVHSNLGIDPSASPMANVARQRAMNPAFQQMEAQGAQDSKPMLDQAQESPTNRRYYVQLATSLNALGHGPMGQGAGFDERQQMGKVYNTVLQMMGLPPQNVDQLAAGDISRKITTLQGAALANQYGQHAASIAHNLAAILPSGETTPAASNEVLATMMVQNQRAQDFQQYQNAYHQRYGTLAGVMQAFNRDTQANYDGDVRSLQGLFKKNAKTGMSPAEVYAKYPNAKTMQMLEKQYGPGISRYLQ